MTMKHNHYAMNYQHCDNISQNATRSHFLSLSVRYNRRQKEREKTILEQGVVFDRLPCVAAEPLSAPRPSVISRPPPELRPFVFTQPKDLSRQATQRGRPAQVPSLPAPQLLTAPPQQQPCFLPGSSQDPPHLTSVIPPPPLILPRSTAFRRRKKAEAEAAAGVSGCPGKKRKQGDYKCSKCGQPKRKETGHSQYGSVSFCSATGGKTVEQWLAEMRDTQGRGDKGH